MRKLFVAAVLLSALASCQTQNSLYTWYNSEDATYAYTKKGTEETLNEAMLQYEKVINNQRGLRRAVPPGVNAEYGFLLYKAGKKNEGLKFLQAEIQAYPESEQFISRIIKQLEK
jgi:hypothetical protein